MKRDIHHVSHPTGTHVEIMSQEGMQHVVLSVESIWESFVFAKKIGLNSSRHPLRHQSGPSNPNSYLHEIDVSVLAVVFLRT